MGKVRSRCQTCAVACVAARWLCTGLYTLIPSLFFVCPLIDFIPSHFALCFRCLQDDLSLLVEGDYAPALSVLVGLGVAATADATHCSLLPAFAPFITDSLRPCALVFLVYFVQRCRLTMLACCVFSVLIFLLLTLIQDYARCACSVAHHLARTAFGMHETAVVREPATFTRIVAAFTEFRCV